MTHNHSQISDNATGQLLAQSDGSLLNTAQASKILNLSESWLRKAVAGNRIPFIRIGTRVLFRRVDLDSWISEHFVPTGAEVEARAQTIAATAMLPRSRRGRSGK